MMGGGAHCGWWAGMAQVDMAGQVETLLGRESPHLPPSPSKSLPLSQQFPGLALEGCSPLGGRKWEGFAFPCPWHLYSGEIGLEGFTRNLADSLGRAWGA